MACEKLKSKISWFFFVVCLGVVFGLILGFLLFGNSTKEEQCKETSCTNGCYNGGVISETKTCTCSVGYGGECCKYKTQACKFGQWSEWTSCSKTCGQAGTQFRTRENDCFDSEHCIQPTYEQRACNVHCYNGGLLSNSTDAGCICLKGYGGECCECEIQDCQMTTWSEWSTCSRTCGTQGTRFRTRDIANATACGGKPCPMVFTEEEECNRQCYNGYIAVLDGNRTCTCIDGYSGECCDCKIQDCVMTSWTNWSECTHMCGPHGVTVRTRNVQTQAACGGAECPKTFSEQKGCNRMCENGGQIDVEKGVCGCPAGFSGQCCDCQNVDCKLSQWSEWSTCENATRQVRSRDVRRYPKCDGRACKKLGSLTDDRSCAVALKHKLLVPNWSIPLLAVYGGVLTLFIVITILLFYKRRRPDFRKVKNGDYAPIM